MLKFRLENREFQERVQLIQTIFCHSLKYMIVQKHLKQISPKPSFLDEGRERGLKLYVLVKNILCSENKKMFKSQICFCTLAIRRFFFLLGLKLALGRHYSLQSLCSSYSYKFSVEVKRANNTQPYVTDKQYLYSEVFVTLMNSWDDIYLQLYVIQLTEHWH